MCRLRGTVVGIDIKDVDMDLEMRDSAIRKE